MMTRKNNLPIARALYACIVLAVSCALWVPVSIGETPTTEYTITSAAGANGTVDPDGSTTATWGTDLELTATADTGYQVDAWSVDGVEAQTGGTGFTLTTIKADHTVDVTFKPLEFEITSAAGPKGAVSPDGTTTVTYSGDLELTATPNAGYEVDTWSLDGEEAQTGGDSFTISDIQADHTVDVTFKKLEFEVTSAAGANGAVSPDGTTVVTWASDLELTATPETGYQVDAWSVDGEEAQTGGDSFTLTSIKANHTVDVTFKLLEFEIASAAGDGGAVSPDGTTNVTYGGGLDLTATPETGYQVDTWSLDAVEAQTGGTDFSLSDIQADHTVEVTFKLLEFEISSAAGENGAVSPDGATTVTYGSDLEFTATPDTGYEVDAWSVDGEEAQAGGNSLSLTDIQADHSVDVTFKLLKFEISSSADPNGQISPDGTSTVTYGSDLEFTATPNTGYQVDAWSVDGTTAQTGGDSFTLEDIQADQTVEVTFRLLEFEITGEAGDNGTISPDGGTTVTYGSDLEFTAAGDGEYMVRIWSLDGVQDQIGGETYTLTNIQADHTVEVSFSLLYYEISPSAGSGGSISPDYTVTGEPNDTVEFSASADDEYDVRAWYVDGSLAQAGGSSFSLTVTSDHDVEVEFDQDSYDVTATAGAGGSVDPRNLTVHSSGNHTFTATPDVGLEVDTWSLDGDVAQTGGATYELSPIKREHKVHVTFKRMLAYSLGVFEFEDEKETEAGIAGNNSDPDQDMVLVEPGPDGDNSVLCLRNGQGSEGQAVNARAKGTFTGTDTDEVLISFKYLFATADAELVVSVSDSPQLLAADDSLRAKHYIEVARLAAPPFDRPGSEGSDRLAAFQAVVWTGDLDLSKGLYVELELVDQDGSSSVCIDSWSSQVQCYGVCLDVNRDNAVDAADFLKVVGAYGLAAEGETACLEGAFSADGYIDSLDVASWDWALNSQQRLAGYCGLALTGQASVKSVAGSENAEAPMLLASVPEALGDLLIAGKKDSDKLDDGLYVFDAAGTSGGSFAPASNRGNISLVRGSDGQIYQLNTETGLVRLDGTDEVVIPSGQLDVANDPRYGASATVSVGIQGAGSDSSGRPILDVAFDAEHAYVIPVVVNPDGGEPYTAAAKLKLSAGGDSPYELVELYDDAPLLNDNQHRNNLREIELDSAGNVYVLNVNALNESDILWRYKPDGAIERLDLGRPDGGSYIPAPAAMFVSQTDGALYLASTAIYKLSTQGELVVEKSIALDGLQHVTGITEDPATGTLWIAGFNMLDIPQDPDPAQAAFYYPHLASISSVDDSVEVIPLFDPASHDLALPMSILWTGVAEQTGTE